jgi:TPR repeat protein
VLALGIAVGVALWQSSAQRQVLDAQQERCAKGDAASCDALRSLCLKRYGDACESLAEAILASPAERRDDRDAMRLLSEACDLRSRRACVRGARKLLEGEGVAKDPDGAKRLVDRGCELGAKEACTLRETSR